MIYNETNLEVNLHISSFWNMEHKIITPTWNDIIKVIGLKLIGKPHELRYADYNKKNAFMDEGELDILNTYFRNTSAPANFYIGLGNNGGTPAVPAETSTLATITEVTGTGYGRILLNRDTVDFGVPVLDSGDYQTTTLTKTFNATGTWTAADYAFVCDVVSGTAGAFIFAVALSASRVLTDGSSLNIAFKTKAQ